MKYIGNKKRLLGFIDESLKNAGIPDSGIFADIFSGTTSVAEHYKNLGYKIISNDFMTYSFVLQKALIEGNKMLCFTDLCAHLSLEESATPVDAVIDYLNGLKPIKGYAFDNYGSEGCQGRMYFTAENAGLIDAIRDEIAIWEKEGLISDAEKYYLLALLIDAADHVANMSGTYGAYLKIWRSVALKEMKLKKRNLVDNGMQNTVYREKAEDLIHRISGDVLYLDPPYNSRQYASNFHVLESIAVWDKQLLAGVAGLRDYSDQKSDFSRKALAPKALEIVVNAAKFRFIALSYNNEGIIPHEEIFQILSNVGKVKVFKTDYRRFRTERNHEKRKYKDVDDRTLEYLFVAEK